MFSLALPLGCLQSVLVAEDWARHHPSTQSGTEPIPVSLRLGQPIPAVGGEAAWVSPKVGSEGA